MLEQHRHTVEDAITKEITKHEEALSLLCSIPGIDVTAAAAIIAEIGTDMECLSGFTAYMLLGRFESR